MKNTDLIVDRFAETLTGEGISIKASAKIDWIDRIMAVLPAKYPPSFMSLISRYVFDEFRADKLWFFANHGDSAPVDLSIAIFEDQFIFKTTTANGFLHFARSEDGSYDPMCFDIRKRKNPKEFPIVRLDHEAILQFDRIRIVDAPYSSLLDLFEKYMKDNKRLHLDRR